MRRQAGYSLLQIMVVLSVVAVLAGGIALTANRNQTDINAQMYVTDVIRLKEAMKEQILEQGTSNLAATMDLRSIARRLGLPPNTLDASDRLNSPWGPLTTQLAATGWGFYTLAASPGGALAPKDRRICELLGRQLVGDMLSITIGSTVINMVTSSTTPQQKREAIDQACQQPSAGSKLVMIFP